MDNAGGSQTLGTVAARVSDYLLTDNVQTVLAAPGRLPRLSVPVLTCAAPPTSAA